MLCIPWSPLAESSGEESEDDDVPSHSIPNSAFSKPTIVKAAASSSGEYETDSEESESEEEENPPPKPTYRPTFVPKYVSSFPAHLCFSPPTNDSNHSPDEREKQSSRSRL